MDTVEILGTVRNYCTMIAAKAACKANANLGYGATNSVVKKEGHDADTI